MKNIFYDRLEKECEKQAIFTISCDINFIYIKSDSVLIDEKDRENRLVLVPYNTLFEKLRLLALKYNQRNIELMFKFI